MYEKHATRIRSTIEQGDKIYPLKAQGIWLSTYESSLQEEGYFVNHKKVYRLMSELNMLSFKEASLL